MTTDWQPIETAPQDGRSIKLASFNEADGYLHHTAICKWDRLRGPNVLYSVDNWMGWDYIVGPSHWARRRDQPVV